MRANERKASNSFSKLCTQEWAWVPEKGKPKEKAL
jgi:hypothetical protein